MTHKHHAGLVTTWTLRLTRKHFVEVFVWEDRSSMWAADDWNQRRFKRGTLKEHAYAGQAVCSILALRNRDGKPKAPRKFGEIWVVRDDCGAGVVSHEVAHMMTFWAQYKAWDIFDKHNEKFAWLTGELNRLFYIGYYKAKL